MKYITIGIALFSWAILLNAVDESAAESCEKLTNETTCCSTDGCAFLYCDEEANNATCVEATNMTTVPGNCSDTCLAVEGTTTDAENASTVVTSGAEGTSTSVATDEAGSTTGSTVETGGTTTSEPITEPFGSTEETGGTTQPPENTTGGEASNTNCNSFDPASFIGGIVLCGGVLAIVFFGCKFYKSRSEKNYHQF